MIFFKQTFSLSQKLLSTVCLMILFWAIFNGIVCYIIPLFITDLGFSKTVMGLLIASSNVFGAIFDFLLCKFLRNTHYRRLFFILYILSFIYPLLVWSSKTLPIFIISMAVWGLYGDIKNFASFDFIGNHYKRNNCQRFGILGIFESVGYLLAPIFAGILMTNVINSLPFIFATIFVFISYLFYLVLVKLSSRNQEVPEVRYRRANFFREFVLWRKIGDILLPVLIFNTLLFIFDATFWAIGPLLSLEFPSFKDFSGFFMAIYILPTLLIGWFVNKITRKYGKKRTAHVAFLIGNIFLLPLFFLKEPVIILITIFFSSFFASFAWPALRSAYADYIYESDKYDKEIESLNDFSTNLGYIIGPIMAGFIADRIGINSTFTLLGIFNIIFVVYLIFITPKSINVVVKK